MEQNIFYKHVLITKKGYEYYSKVIAGERITFTRIEIGNGELEDGKTAEELKLLEGIISHKKTINISAVTQNHTQAVIHANINSNDLTEAFKFKEVGIYAEINGEEILYAYLHTGEEFEYLRPTSAGQASIFNFEFAVSVGKAENVEVIFSNTTIVNNSINIDMLDESVKEYIANYVDNAISTIKPSLPSTNNKFEIIKDGDNYIANINGDLAQDENDFVLNL